MRVPGHPWSTGAFVLVSALIGINTVYKYPGESLIGFALLLAGVPVAMLWTRRARAAR